MNLNQLRYVLEIEQSHSITAAAKHLFISQPNLSRELRLLEEEIGFPIFDRHVRGCVPTDQGYTFLQLAKRTIHQYRQLEDFCQKEDPGHASISLSVPVSSRITLLLPEFLSAFPPDTSFNVTLHEEEVMRAIRSAENRSCSAAILRFPRRYEEMLLSLLKVKDLHTRKLSHYELGVLVSKYSPLASISPFQPEHLRSYTQVIYEDASLSAWLKEPEEHTFSESTIHLHEQSMQHRILQQMSNAYLLSEPLPKAFLDNNDLVQLPLRHSIGAMTELLIWPEGSRLTPAEQGFLDMIYA